MKFILLLSFFSSLVFSAILDTQNGKKIEIFSHKSTNSKLVATPPISKGRFDTKFCTKVDNDVDWCKVEYIDTKTLIAGYIQKELLDSLENTTKNSTRYEASYGGNRDEVANAVLRVKDGIVLAGYTKSFGAARTDAYFVKVDFYGNKIYDAVFGGELDERLNDVIELEDGYVAVGSTQSYRGGLESGYFVRLSKDGDILNESPFYVDKKASYKINDIVKKDDNSLTIIGNNKYKKFFISNKDGFLASTDKDAKRTLFKVYGDRKTENMNTVASTENGFIMAGSSKSWGSGSSDMYVVKTDTNGKIIWQNVYGLQNEEVAHHIITTEDGGFIIVGTTQSIYANKKDMMVVKISSIGRKVWMKSFGSNEDEEAYGIVETNDGYIIAGYTNDTQNHESDVVVLKIDKDGNEVFQRRYGGQRDDRAYAISRMRDGYLVAGYTTSSDTYSKDMYLLRLNLEGKIE